MPVSLINSSGSEVARTGCPFTNLQRQKNIQHNTTRTPCIHFITYDHWERWNVTSLHKWRCNIMLLMKLKHWLSTVGFRGEEMPNSLDKFRYVVSQEVDHCIRACIECIRHLKDLIETRKVRLSLHCTWIDERCFTLVSYSLKLYYTLVIIHSLKNFFVFVILFYSHWLVDYKYEL